MNKLLAPLLIFLLFSCRDSGTLPITELDEAKLIDAVLLDVRTPEEYSMGHLEGALHIDWFAEDFKARVDALERSKTIYVYCKAGGRSAKAAAVMRDMGFKNVVNLEGGYDAFSAQAE